MSAGIKSRLMVLFFIPMMFLLSCSDKTPVRERGGYEKGSIFKSDKDTPIPRKLVHLLEKDYIDVFREDKPDSSLTDLELRLKVPRRLMQINVYIKEKTPGTITRDSLFALPQGGGTMDLAGVVNEGKGVFHLDFDISGLSEEQLEKVRVFYVSNAKRFEVHGKTFGAGCGKFFEVTRFFHEVIRSRGMELAAADFRYLGQILGTFFFSFPESDNLYVGSATFVDSRYKDTHCLFSGN